MNVRQISTALALALIVAACTPNPDTPTTVESECEAKIEVSHVGALIRADIFVVNMANSASTPKDHERGIDELDQGLADVAIFNFNSNDPLAELADLRAQCIDANPVHLLAAESHWTLEGGGDTGVPLSYQPPAQAEFAVERKVALIDVEESPGRGHLTFIKNIITQVDPSVEVIEKPISLSLIPSQILFIGPDGERLALPANLKGHLTDELEVAKAILSLTSEAEQYDALNLSLGTYAVMVHTRRGSRIVGAPLLRLALEQWFSAGGGHVFAAAGSDIAASEEMFVPAAFHLTGMKDLFGVGATNPKGDPVLWDDGVEVPGAVSLSDNCSLPGASIVSTVDDNTSEVLRWGGSSFATAVATALFPRDTKPVCGLAHKDIANLIYCAGADLFDPDGTQPCI